MDEKEGGPSKSVVSCWGLCISGPDRGGFWSSIVLTVIPAGLYFGFVYVFVGLLWCTKIDRIAKLFVWWHLLNSTHLHLLLDILSQIILHRINTCFRAPVIWNKLNPALIILSAFTILFTIVTLCIAGFSDPGILITPSINTNLHKGIIPRRREKPNHLIYEEVTLKGHTWNLKYCGMCNGHILLTTGRYMSYLQTS